MFFVGYNLNSSVRVKLTKAGLKHYSTRYGVRREPPAQPKLDDEGYYRTELWSLMNDFGSVLYNGCEVPFDMANIQFDLHQTKKA
jgi:hypothetical protein